MPDQTFVEITTGDARSSAFSHPRWAFFCRLAAIVAVALSFALTLGRPYQPRHLRMPDPWAYAIAIENFARGRWTITDAEASAESMRVRLQGGRLTQYARVGSNRWALTKSPGYPLLAIPFQWLGQPRWANAALAILSTLCLYALLAAWRNEWAALFGVTLWLFSPLSLMAQHQAYMDTYAAGAVPLIGGALVLGYGLQKTGRHPGIGLLLGGIALGWAAAIRAPNIALLVPAGGYLLLAAWQRSKTGQSGAWRPLLAFGLGYALALAMLAAYNLAVFGRPVDIGYQYGPYRTEFAWWAGEAPEGQPSSVAAAELPSQNWAVIPWNLRRWAQPLWIGWPLLPLGLVGLCLAFRTRQDRLFAGWALLWIALAYLPYTGLFSSGITRELGNPFNLHWGFYIVDRLLFPIALPITLLMTLAVARLPRWLLAALAVAHAFLGVWVFHQALAAMA